MRLSGNPCRRMDRYEELGELGKGKYGVVCKVRRRLDGRVLALKKVPCEDLGEANEALEEVSLARRYFLYSARTVFGVWSDPPVGSVTAGDQTSAHCDV